MLLTNNTIKKSRSMQIYMDLKNKIMNNYKVDDKLPSEKELCEEYGVSRITVRGALKELVDEDIVYSVQGKGFFVKNKINKLITIGNIMHSFLYDESNPEYKYFFRNVLPSVVSIEKEVRNNKAQLVIYNSELNPNIERQHLENVLLRQLDGLIIFYIGENKNIDYLNQIKEANIPIVMFDRNYGDFKADSITTNNFEGAFIATNKLIEKGFKKIIHISSDEQISSIIDRENGYLNAVNAVNIEPIIFKMNPGKGFDISAKEIIKEHINDMDDNVAIFTATSSPMVGSIEALIENGKNIDNMGFACFDRLPVDFPEKAYFINILQQYEEMGRVAVNILMSRINGGSHSYQNYQLSPTINEYNK